MSAPRPANSRAIARPIPREDPVIRATRPSNDLVVLYSISRCSHIVIKEIGYSSPRARKLSTAPEEYLSTLVEFFL